MAEERAGSAARAEHHQRRPALVVDGAQPFGPTTCVGNDWFPGQKLSNIVADAGRCFGPELVERRHGLFVRVDPRVGLDPADHVQRRVVPMVAHAQDRRVERGARADHRDLVRRGRAPVAPPRDGAQGRGADRVPARDERRVERVERLEARGRRRPVRREHVQRARLRRLLPADLREEDEGLRLARRRRGDGLRRE